MSQDLRYLKTYISVLLTFNIRDDLGGLSSTVLRFRIPDRLQGQATRGLFLFRRNSLKGNESESAIAVQKWEPTRLVKSQTNNR